VIQGPLVAVITTAGSPFIAAQGEAFQPLAADQAMVKLVG
jgi:hypothetical protein